MPGRQKCGLRSLVLTRLAGPVAALAVVIALAPWAGAAVAAATAAPWGITFNSEDPMFAEPCIDIDEWRDVPVRHRCVHGGKKPWGYACGGSGCAYRTVRSMESAKGVRDGAVPCVPGSTMAIPDMFTVRMQVMRILADRAPGIVDPLEPGGSGDPRAGLDTDASSEANRGRVDNAFEVLKGEQK